MNHQEQREESSYYNMMTPQAGLETVKPSPHFLHLSLFAPPPPPGPHLGNKCSKLVSTTA